MWTCMEVLFDFLGTMRMGMEVLMLMLLMEVRSRIYAGFLAAMQ